MDTLYSTLLAIAQNNNYPPLSAGFDLIAHDGTVTIYIGGVDDWCMLPLAVHPTLVRPEHLNKTDTATRKGPKRQQRNSLVVVHVVAVAVWICTSTAPVFTQLIGAVASTTMCGCTPTFPLHY